MYCTINTSLLFYRHDMTKESAFYVSNKKLYEVYKQHIEDVNLARQQNKPIPKMHPFIAESVVKIANKYANRPNFIRYSYRDEMIADAIEMCCRNYLKFNPEKSDNPFSYLTQFCHNSFLQRIAKEKRQQSIKAKYLKNSIIEDIMVTQNHDDEEFKNTMVEFLLENDVYVDSIDEKKQRLRKEADTSKQLSPIENLFKDNLDEDSSDR